MDKEAIEKLNKEIDSIKNSGNKKEYAKFLEGMDNDTFDRLGRKMFCLFGDGKHILIQARKDWKCMKEWRDETETTGKVVLSIRKRRDLLDKAYLASSPEIALTKDEWGLLSDAVEKVFKETSEEVV